jgi:hypothetical protein
MRSDISGVTFLPGVQGFNLENCPYSREHIKGCSNILIELNIEEGDKEETDINH